MGILRRRLFLGMPCLLMVFATAQLASTAFPDSLCSPRDLGRKDGMAIRAECDRLTSGLSSGMDASEKVESLRQLLCSLRASRPGPTFQYALIKYCDALVITGQRKEAIRVLEKEIPFLPCGVLDRKLLEKMLSLIMRYGDGLDKEFVRLVCMDPFVDSITRIRLKLAVELAITSEDVREIESRLSWWQQLEALKGQHPPEPTSLADTTAEATDAFLSRRDAYAANYWYRRSLEARYGSVAVGFLARQWCSLLLLVVGLIVLLLSCRAAYKRWTNQAK